MTKNSTDARRKPRARIGSDQARTWARGLRIGNPYAKSILIAVANYMNEDGTAWPGIATIAADTDIADDTVVTRLRWCESIGAITLRKCWIDENGRRIYENRGRPTSSEIRFLFDANPDDIAARAIGASKPKVLRGAALVSHETKAVSPRPDGEQTSVESTEISTRPQREQNPISSRLAPCQPPTPAARREEDKPKEDSVRESRARENQPDSPSQAIARELLASKGLPYDAIEGCGLPYQVEAWLNAGIGREFILSTCLRVVATKPKFPHLNYLIATVRSAWAEHCAQPTPSAPEIRHETNQQQPARTGWQRSRDAFRAARDELSAAAEAGEQETDPGGGPPPEILPRSGCG